MADDVRSVLIGTAGLAVAAGAAILLAAARGPITAGLDDRRAAARLAAVAIVAQAAHFGEELATGFHRRFPAQLGLVPWSDGFFVAFNVGWLVVWCVAARALLARRRPALAALWFLGIAGVANGIVHPLLAVRVGGYFPGLVTSPLIGIAGVALVRRLAGLTGRVETAPARSS